MALTKAHKRMITGITASVVDYGADPTGVNDSTAAIQAALSNNDSVVFEPGIYKCSSQITVSNKDTRIYGNGATIQFSSGDLRFEGSIGSDYTISANANRGANQLTVSGGSFSEGDILSIVDETTSSFSLHRTTYYKGQLLTVRSESSNVVTLDDYLIGSWITGANIKVRKITPIQVIIKDLNVELLTGNTSNFVCRISYAQDVLVENCSFTGGDSVSAALAFRQSKGGIFRNCRCICDSPATGTEYGFSSDDSEHALVEGCYLYGTRHGSHIGGSGNTGSKFITFRNCIISNEPSSVYPYAADIHGNSQNTVYEGCTIYGGAALAGLNASYINNVIYASNASGQSAGPIVINEIVGGNFTIENNELSTAVDGDNAKIIAIQASADYGKINASYNIKIINNIITACASTTDIVRIGTHYDRPTVQPSITFENNEFRGDCSNVTIIVRVASVQDPSTSTYVAATGPFEIKDFQFDVTGSMPSTVKILDKTQGTFDSSAIFVLPERHYKVALNVLSSNSSRSDTLTYDFDYGEFAPCVIATVEDFQYVGNFAPFAAISNSTGTGCTVHVGSTDATNTIGTSTVYTVNVRVGGGPSV